MVRVAPSSFVALLITLTACLVIAPVARGQAVAAERLTTFGTSGKAVYPFTEGSKTEAVLYEHEGKGCLTHMWFGGNWPDYERLRIRIYVDGEETASIDFELFLGHGIGFKDHFGPWGTRRVGKTGDPSGVYNTYRVPFGQRIKITAQLHAGDEKNKRFWYIFRGVEGMPIEFNGVRLPERARLKLHKLEGYRAETLEEFDFLNVEGAGMVYQVTMAAEGEKGHTYLESCVRGYFDGSEEPVLLSSGLEDYFLGTYFFHRGMYHHDVAGLTHLDPKAHTFSAYRFHEEDPIFFKKGLRLTLRCGEEIGNQTHNERTQTWKAPPTTYTTYVWVYHW